MNSDQDRTLWERGWEDHEKRQRERLSTLPFSDRLRWLEEAHHLVLHLSRVAPRPVERLETETEA